MRIRRHAHPEHVSQMRLNWRDEQQIDPPHYLPDFLPGIVEDDGEVVRRRSVVSAYDQIVEFGRDRAMENVIDRPCGGFSAQTQGGGAFAPTLIAFDIAEIATRPRIS